MIEYPTKVMLATDGTEDSARAAWAAVALSTKTGAELHVVHVGQAAASGSGVTVEGRSLPAEPYESVVKRAGRLLERQVEQVRELGGAVAGAHLRMGRPAPEVVSLSDELGVDLLVVGSGRPRTVRRAVSGTVRRSALGAVSDYIVRSARCPVLVVHGEDLPEAGSPAAGA